MELGVKRFNTGEDSTIGLLFDITDGNKFLCYTLEDGFNIEKIAKETRIPPGRYEIKLRTTGGFHSKYLSKFGKDFHKGMLHIVDVPNYKYILIHIGNTIKDTEGCLLLGDSQSQNITKSGTLTNSANAYKRVYEYVSSKLVSGEKVFITFIDE
jgi:hypothetical protein